MSFSLTYFNDGYSELSLWLYLMSLNMLKMIKMIHFMFYILSQIKINQIIYHFLLHLLGSKSLSSITLSFALHKPSSITWLQVITLPLRIHLYAFVTEENVSSVILALHPHDSPSMCSIIQIWVDCPINKSQVKIPTVFDYVIQHAIGFLQLLKQWACHSRTCLKYKLPSLEWILKFT